MLASFIVALLIFVERIGGKVEDFTWNKLQWLKVGDFTLNMGFEVNESERLDARDCNTGIFAGEYLFQGLYER